MRFNRDARVGGLAHGLAVEEQQRVAADDEGVPGSSRNRARHGARLGDREGLDQLPGVRGRDNAFVDVADDDLRVQARVTQQPQPRAGRGGQHEATGHPSMQARAGADFRRCWVSWVSR
jgi:hypothetical protein